MLRAGAIFLTMWTGFNLVVAVCILFAILILGKNAPALVILYGNTHAAGMDPRALATINAIAVVFNACAGALCALSLAVIWFALLHKARWAFWSVAGSLGFVQAAGFASDSFLRNKDLLANVASSLLLLFGLVLAAMGLLRSSGD